MGIMTKPGGAANRRKRSKGHGRKTGLRRRYKVKTRSFKVRGRGKRARRKFRRRF